MKRTTHSHPTAAPEVIVAGLLAMGYKEAEALPEHRLFIHTLTEGQSCVLLSPTGELLRGDHPRVAGAKPVSDAIWQMLVTKGTAALATAAPAKAA